MFVEMVVKISFLVLFILVASSILYGAPYVVSDKKTIKKALKLIGNIKNRKVVDLGSGDGRLVLELSKRGAYATGYEINPILVLISKVRILFSKDKGRAKVYLGNYWTKDLSDNEFVVVFGISYIMLRLETKLMKELKRGARVISVSYKFPNWKPIKSFMGVYLYKR